MLIGHPQIVIKFHLLLLVFGLFQILLALSPEVFNVVLLQGSSVLDVAVLIPVYVGLALVAAGSGLTYFFIGAGDVYFFFICFFLFESQFKF